MHTHPTLTQHQLRTVLRLYNVSMTEDIDYLVTTVPADRSDGSGLVVVELRQNGGFRATYLNDIVEPEDHVFEGPWRLLPTKGTVYVGYWGMGYQDRRVSIPWIFDVNVDDYAAVRDHIVAALRNHIAQIPPDRVISSSQISVLLIDPDRIDPDKTHPWGSGDAVSRVPYLLPCYYDAGHTPYMIWWDADE